MLLFVYGTLRDGDVRNVVFGRPLEPRRVRPAELRGWRLLQSAEGPWPHIKRAPGRRVDGMVLGPLSETEMGFVTHFESDEYVVTACRPRLRHGVHVDAMFARTRGHVSCRDRNWDLAEWRRDHKRLLLRYARGYMIRAHRAAK